MPSKQSVETIVLYDADRRPSRKCGDCQLCCKLIPVEEFNKRAGERCRHQKRGTGCAIYERRPLSCQLWNCRWLVEPDTQSLPRPDRSHYVIDIMPDYVTLQPHDGSAVRHLGVIQVWVDPAFPDAHKAASFRAWLDAQGMCALIRFGSSGGFLLAPPSVTGQGWQEQQSNTTPGPPHNLHDVARVLGGDTGLKIATDMARDLKRVLK